MPAPGALRAPPARAHDARRLLAELLGSAFLAALVIGSGIAAAALPGDTGLQLFENAAATAAGLFTIILMFGPVSGGHFNPVVSLVDAHFGGIRWRDALAYLPAQVIGCILGAIAANVMFSLAAVSISTHHRASPGAPSREVIATAGLILVIFALARTSARTIAAAVGAYIGAAYFFTSSTSFANPAITVGRMFSNTFAGIAPASVPAFIVAQLLGADRRDRIRVLYPDISPETPPRSHSPTPTSTPSMTDTRRSRSRGSRQRTAGVCLGSPAGESQSDRRLTVRGVAGGLWEPGPVVEGAGVGVVVRCRRVPPRRVGARG